MTGTEWCFAPFAKCFYTVQCLHNLICNVVEKRMQKLTNRCQIWCGKAWRAYERNMLSAINESSWHIHIPSDMNLHHYHQHRDHHHHHHQWMLKKTHFSDRAGSSNNWLPLANNYSSSQLTSWRADPVTTKHPVSRSPALKLIVYKNTLMMKQNSDPPRIPWLDMRLIHLKRASVLILEIRDEGEILPPHPSARDLMRHGSGHSPRREYFGT